jgi:hypothetical protein
MEKYLIEIICDMNRSIKPSRLRMSFCMARFVSVMSRCAGMLARMFLDEFAAQTDACVSVAMGY